MASGLKGRTFWWGYETWVTPEAHRITRRPRGRLSATTVAINNVVKFRHYYFRSI